MKETGSHILAMESKDPILKIRLDDAAIAMTNDWDPILKIRLDDTAMTNDRFGFVRMFPPLLFINLQLKKKRLFKNLF